MEGWTIVWLAVATASISFTMGPRTPVFDWLRDWLDDMNLNDGSNFEHWLTKQLRALMGCPYCIAHWVAFFFTIIWHPMPFTGTFVDLLIVAFSIVTLACLLIQLMSIFSYASSVLKHIAEDNWPTGWGVVAAVEPAAEPLEAASEKPADVGAGQPAPASPPFSEQA